MMVLLEFLVLMTGLLSVFCVACVVEKIVMFFMAWIGDRRCS